MLVLDVPVLFRLEFLDWLDLGDLLNVLPDLALNGLGLIVMPQLLIVHHLSKWKHVIQNLGYFLENALLGKSLSWRVLHFLLKLFADDVVYQVAVCEQGQLLGMVRFTAFVRHEQLLVHLPQEAVDIHLFQLENVLPQHRQQKVFEL